MTSSKSRVSRSSRILVTLVVLLAWTGLAAAGRKRVVVLDFKGDGAAKIQQGVVALLKKSHTVLSQEKWDDTASDLSATSLSEKNIKKVARKLKIDGIVSGQVEKRRGDYIIRIKLRAGTTGEVVGDQINVKSGSAKLDDTAQSDLADELVSPIGALATNRGGSSSDDADDDEVAAKPVKKGKAAKAAADEDEDDVEPVKPAKASKKPAKVAVEDEEEDADFEDSKPKKGFSRRKSDADKPNKKATKVAKSDAEADEDEAPKPKPKKRPAKAADDDDDGDEVAASDEEEDGPSELREDSDEDADATERNPRALTPQERAVDAVAGLSFNMRRLGFNYTEAVATEPNGYKSIPLPGVMVDITIFPGAIGHKRGGIAENIGATVMFDRVLLISSQDLEGNKLATTQQRFAVGVVARYPLKAAVIGGALRFGKQTFSIGGESPVPDTAYTVINPSVFVRYPVGRKLLLNVAAGALAVTNTGEIQEMSQYGGASVLGIQVGASVDYALKANLFVRGGLDVTSYGYSFAGTGMRTQDAMGGQAVGGARDTYIGFAANLGYLY